MNWIQRFKRSTHSTSFIPEIDGLRFFAIITVIAYHLNTAVLKSKGYTFASWKNMIGVESMFDIGWWFIRLDVGVKVFFAISGFILATPFLKQYIFKSVKLNLSDYFVRRLTRLEPPFIISLVVFFLVHVLFLHASPVDLIPHFMAGLLYGHVFVYGEPNPINPVTWSLETEAQFYIVLPLLAYFIFRFRAKWTSIIIIVLLSVISIWCKSHFFYSKVHHLESSVIAYLTNFLSGGIFACLYLSYPNFFNKRKSWIYDGIGIISILLMFVYYKPQAYWINNIILNLSILGLFLSVFKGALSNWFYTRPWIYLLGGMCYSLYLLHYAFFYLVVKYSIHLPSSGHYWMDWLVQFLIVFPLFLFFASLFYLWIEKPCMNKDWPKKLSLYFKVKS